MYIITGASGWMGRTTLEYLKNVICIDLKSDVRCFSSTNKSIQLSDGEVVQSRSLDQLQGVTQHVEGIFHFAFLTRDYVQKLGLTDYLRINRSILELLSRALPHMNYNWIVGISSGAVFDPSTENYALDPNQNPYGFLKLQEETLLRNHSETSGSNCMIGRLWASSGNLMPIDRKYALSDFIYQGLTSDRIIVNSSHEVWRRYMDAQDFIQALHIAAKQGKNLILDSNGELIEIGTLASKIASITSSEMVRLSSGANSSPDKYYPEGAQMSLLIEEFGLKLKSIDEQIVSTISGHRYQLISGERFN